MGYRVDNAYEAPAEEERRDAWTALPRRARILVRLRQAAMVALMIGAAGGVFLLVFWH